MNWSNEQRLRDKVKAIEHPWISVGDRLPKEHGTYFARSEDVVGVRYDEWIVDINPYSGEPRSIPSFCTHWMKIPELTHEAER